MYKYYSFLIVFFLVSCIHGEGIEPSDDNSLLNTSDDSLETLDDSEETTTGITSTPSTTTTTDTLDKLP